MLIDSQSAKRETASPPKNLSNMCQALYNFYFVFQQRINNKSKEKARPSWAINLKPTPVSTLFIQLSDESSQKQ